MREYSGSQHFIYTKALKSKTALLGDEDVAENISN